MTNMDKRHDQDCLEDNLEQLLKLGESSPGMPEDLKSRIRSILVQMEPESGKKSILPGRRTVWALAAAAVLVFFFIVFWNGGSPTTIVWADVQGQLDKAHTLTFSGLTGISATTGMRVTGRIKVYYKDPGLARTVEYLPDTDSGSVEEEPRKITIIRREPGSSEGVILYPGAGRAELFDSVVLTDSPKPPSQPPMDLASFNWELMKETATDKTRRIGDRIINGIPAVGFEFEIPDRVYVNPDRHVRAQLWASGYDGTPLLIEVEYRDPLGQNMHTEYSDFRWNVPLDESLFDLAVPEGWRLSRIRTESAEYADAGLAPGVTLQISPDGQEPLTDTEDVVRVVRGEQITHPDSDIPRDVRITIELKPEAIQRLRDYARANPDELIVVDFNGKIRVVPSLYGAGPTQLSFDLSLLDLPLAELEDRYFTTTIERNGL
jgi:outer membrane lipoprotein-sorting protein